MGLFFGGEMYITIAVLSGRTTGDLRMRAKCKLPQSYLGSSVLKGTRKKKEERMFAPAAPANNEPAPAAAPAHNEPAPAAAPAAVPPVCAMEPARSGSETDEAVC